MKSGQKNTKNLSIVKTQKVLVKGLIVKEEKKITDQNFDNKKYRKKSYRLDETQLTIIDVNIKV